MFINSISHISYYFLQDEEIVEITQNSNIVTVYLIDKHITSYKTPALTKNTQNKKVYCNFDFKKILIFMFLKGL